MSFKGVHWSKLPNAEEIRLKIKASKMAKPTKYWLGRKHTLEEKLKISQTKKNDLNTPRGVKHHAWKGGITPEHQKVRNSLSYKIWKESVYKRDKSICYICKKMCMKSNRVAHHWKSHVKYPELRFVVENGITVCRKCHPTLHITHT